MSRDVTRVFTETQYENYITNGAATSHTEIFFRRNPRRFSTDGDNANRLQETKRGVGRRSEWESRSRLLANGERRTMAYRGNQQHEKRSGKAHGQVRVGSYRRARTNLEAGLGCRRFGVARRECDLSGAPRTERS